MARSTSTLLLFDLASRQELQWVACKNRQEEPFPSHREQKIGRERSERVRACQLQT